MTSMSDPVAVSPAVEQLARAALAEITKPHTIGARLSVVDEGEHVVSLHFDALLPGYAGWRWTVSIAELPDADPTVLETELTPGDAALLAPDWVPWADRLADYRAAQQAAEHESGDGEDDAEDVDEDDLDDDDDDELDGVDVDELGDASEDDDDDSDDDGSDDDDEDSDDENDVYGDSGDEDDDDSGRY
jgi:hypothetical protein